VAVIDSVEPLLRGVPIDAESLSPDELLPAAALAEWTAILQNVLLNAVNAIVTSGAAGVIRVSYRVAPRKRSLRVEDTGVGIDLDMADRYFRAFERALPGHAGRDAALGGSGLGLTIVRIVANRIGCHATFVEPAEGYATAFELAWEE
jgi:signal transduction histidine kinase